MSNHDMICLSYKCDFKTNKNYNYIYYRDYNNIDFEALLYDFHKLPWIHIYSCIKC